MINKVVQLLLSVKRSVVARYLLVKCQKKLQSVCMYVYELTHSDVLLLVVVCVLLGCSTTNTKHTTADLSATTVIIITFVRCDLRLFHWSLLISGKTRRLVWTSIHTYICIFKHIYTRMCVFMYIYLQYYVWILVKIYLYYLMYIYK